MAGPSVSLDAIVVGKRPPTEAFETLTLFSQEQGAQFVLQRLARKSSSSAARLDLFDEASVLLENSTRGSGQFLKESRLITRHVEIGRNYDALRFASHLATLVSRNPVGEESRSAVYTLLRQAFSSFAQSPRPDIVYFKSLYLFSRDEGYPVKQQWFPTLPGADRESVATLLNLPVAEQSLSNDQVAKLQLRLENYLRNHTEIQLD